MILKDITTLCDLGIIYNAIWLFLLFDYIYSRIGLFVYTFKWLLNLKFKFIIIHLR